MSIFRNFYLIIVIVLLGCTIGTANTLTDNYPKNTKVDAINYAFKIALSDETDEIVCEATIAIHFRGVGVETLRFDLINSTQALGGKGMQISSVESEGKPLSYTHLNDELIIKLPSSSQLDQLTSYVIKYKGIPATGLKIGNNKYGERTFFSDNWPNKARNWLVTIDHPYDKATSEFMVTAPSHYQIVSNGLRVEETDLPDAKRLTHWKNSVPIAPWLYVLGAARFAVQYVDTFDGKSIET